MFYNKFFIKFIIKKIQFPKRTFLCAPIDTFYTDDTNSTLPVPNINPYSFWIVQSRAQLVNLSVWSVR